MHRERRRNRLVRFFEYMERLPWVFANYTYVRFPRLGVNREQPREELRHSIVPKDVQREAAERLRQRRIEGGDD